VHVTAGQTHEAKGFEPVVNAVRIKQPIGRPRTRPWRLAGDRGYDIPRIRHWLRAHGIRAVIPEKSKPHGRKPGRPPALDHEAYQRRNVVERCVGWLKHARRIATRYEKTAVNFLAMLTLAMIQRYFRTHLRDTT
jgi:transposase